jgi:hypothetical protein
MARRTREEILTELFREFPEGKRIIQEYDNWDVVGYFLLGSQNWATKGSVLQAFKEHRFEEVKAAKKMAERLFSLVMEYQLYLLLEDQKVV